MKGKTSHLNVFPCPSVEKFIFDIGQTPRHSTERIVVESAHTYIHKLRQRNPPLHYHDQVGEVTMEA